MASIQYSVATPPLKEARKTSSSDPLRIEAASHAPPFSRWWQVAERTPVSSVMKARTSYLRPLRDALTSEIAVGRASSAIARRPRQNRHTTTNANRIRSYCQGPDEAGSGQVTEVS